MQVLIKLNFYVNNKIKHIFKDIMYIIYKIGGAAQVLSQN